MIISNDNLQNIMQKIIPIRKHLHRHPELSNQEYQTTQLIRKILEEHSIEIIETNLKTGLIAKVGKKGAKIALRADIDALPINESKESSVSSVHPNIMHACGHDFHTAALLGTAIYLKQYENTLNNQILFLFQPAEEIATGALQMIQTGELKDCQAIFGIHNKPDLPLGCIGITEHPMMAAVDHFHFTVNGRGGHAGLPHLTSDPIITTGQIILDSQTLISRRKNPKDAAVLSITKIISGNTWNVIPETAEIEGTLRTFDPKTRIFLKQELINLVENICQLNNQTVHITWNEGPPTLKNNASLTNEIKQILSKQTTTVTPDIVFGGEDFAYYQSIASTVFAFIGTGTQIDWHNPLFRVSDEALYYAALFYLTSLKVMENY